MYSQVSAVNVNDVKKTGINYKKMVKNAVMGSIFGIFIIIFSLFISSLVLHSTVSDPDKYLSIFLVSSTIIGSFIGGFYAAKTYKTQGFLCGIITGLIMSVIILVIMLVFGNSKTENVFVSRLLNISFQTIAALFGGIIAVNKKSSKKTITKRRTK